MIGNLIGAVVGIVFDYFSNPKFEQSHFMPVWVAATVAPVITIGLMALTATTHPPAAACTIIYILGNEVGSKPSILNPQSQIHAQSYT